MPARKTARAMFCGVACRNADYRKLQAAAVLEAKANRTPCGHCGAAIPTGARADQIFCNIHCQRRGIYHRKKAARQRTCEICDVPYLAAADGQRTCSLKCAVEIRRRPDPIACKQCGATIDAPLLRQIFCGRGCNTIWHNRAKADRARLSS